MIANILWLIENGETFPMSFEGLLSYGYLEALGLIERTEWIAVPGDWPVYRISDDGYTLMDS